MAITVDPLSGYSTTKMSVAASGDAGWCVEALLVMESLLVVDLLEDHLIVAHPCQKVGQQGWVGGKKGVGSNTACL